MPHAQLVRRLQDAQAQAEWSFETELAFGHAVDDVLRTVERAKTLRPVLWVDDADHEPLRGALRLVGIRVDVVATTADALHHCAMTDVGVVVTSLARVEEGLPRPFAGIELLQAWPTTADRPDIVVYAGRRGVEHQDELLDEGARLVIDRPSVLLREVVRTVAA